MEYFDMSEVMILQICAENEAPEYPARVVAVAYTVPYTWVELRASRNQLLRACVLRL